MPCGPTLVVSDLKEISLMARRSQWRVPDAYSWSLRWSQRGANGTRAPSSGHRITGDRRGASTGMGCDVLHVAIDDATRLAYVEVLADERRRSTTGFLVRALRWFRARGVRVERVMTDNGPGYVARLFRKACRMLHLRHIRTRPYTPRTNGKAERFIQTLLREWAYAIPFQGAVSPMQTSLE